MLEAVLVPTGYLVHFWNYKKNWKFPVKFGQPLRSRCKSGLTGIRQQTSNLTFAAGLDGWGDSLGVLSLADMVCLVFVDLPTCLIQQYNHLIQLHASSSSVRPSSSASHYSDWGKDGWWSLSISLLVQFLLTVPIVHIVWITLPLKRYLFAWVFALIKYLFSCQWVD